MQNTPQNHSPISTQSLKHISNEVLHSETVKASKNEKHATLVLLEHLAEVDARRLYAIKSCKSLWEYVHKKLGYSESQTSERVDSMRLMRQVPEVKKELENGNLNLTNIVKLASHVSREKCTEVEILNLLKTVMNKSTREVERVLAPLSTAPAQPDKVKVVSKTLTRITLDVDQEFLDLMTRVQELKGHAGSKPQELFKIAMDEFVKRREVKIKEVNYKNKISKKQEPVVITQGASQLINAQPLNSACDKEKFKKNTSSLRAPEVRMAPVQNNKNENRGGFITAPKKHSRYIAVTTKTKIRIRSGDQCEYMEPHTHQRCESRMNLQFEHVKPHAAGGENTSENLKHYCATHNRLSAIQYFGSNKMEKYLKN